MKKPPGKSGGELSKESLEKSQGNPSPIPSPAQVCYSVPPAWQHIGDVVTRIISRIPEGAGALATSTATDGGGQ